MFQLHECVIWGVSVDWMVWGISVDWVNGRFGLSLSVNFVACASVDWMVWDVSTARVGD